MLNPEEAKKYLEERRIKDSIARSLKQIAQLPDELRSIGYALIYYDSHGKPFKRKGYYYYGATSEEAYEAQIAALQQLDLLPASERISVFEVFFPKIAPRIELTWQFLKRQPYQVGHQRKSFRAPSESNATFHIRRHWLDLVLDAVSMHRDSVSKFHEDVVWLAEWAAYLSGGYADYQLSPLFAATIEADDELGDKIYDILIASATGEHEIGLMGRHVVRALLASSRQDGWEFVEKMLLAAQRQEGLRQTILESVDEAHPGAFRRILRVIVENDLARFSATVRAMNVWLGFMWDSESVRLINQTLSRLLTLLESPQAIQEALQSDDGETVYLALWTLAFDDAMTAIEAALPILSDPKLERRFAAVHLLGELKLPDAYNALLPALDDEDLRVATRALNSLHYLNANEISADMFERLERNFPRFPKEKTLEPLIWPWMTLTASQEALAGLMVHYLRERPPTRLIPYIKAMQHYQRKQAADKLAAQKMWDKATRDALLSLLGDPAQWVRQQVYNLFQGKSIQPDEAEYLEGLLTRTASDLRRGVISLLVAQKDDPAFASAERLLSAGKQPQRLAGLEMVRLLREKNRQTERTETVIANFKAKRGQLTADEEEALKWTVAAGTEKPPTLDDALGLMNPAERTQPDAPQKRDVALTSKASQELLKSLDDLIHEHRKDVVVIDTWQGEREMLLGDMDNYWFPQTDHTTSIEEDAAHLPMRELWETWWNERPANMRDKDGLELLRAKLYFFQGEAKVISLVSLVGARPKQDKLRLRYLTIVQSILVWLLRLHPPLGTSDFLLDAFETFFANIPVDKLKEDGTGLDYYKEEALLNPLYWTLTLIRQYRDWLPEKWTDEHRSRLWSLLWYALGRIPDRAYSRPTLEETMAAYKAGAVREADLYDFLLGQRAQRRQYYGWHELGWLTGQRPHPLTKEYPLLGEVAQRCRDRVVEIELQRGAMPTAASGPARSLRSSGGTDVFLGLLKGLGKETLVRGYVSDNQSKASIYSHLLRVSFPQENETPEDFAKKVKAYKISQQRLIEAAVYAPQWANFVESALGWPFFTEAVFWVHAHTKDQQWRVDKQIRESWQAQVSERTPLSGDDLLAGGVDVTWFWRMYKGLGAERWDAVYEAAKYSSGGGGHARAKLFADAMLGKLTLEECAARISDKRNQDAVRALGLLPLPKGKKREAEILARYKIVQEFLRTSRKFGSQRQVSEKRAAEIGLENLARAAGYPDPLRLQWAMEAQAVADLKAGPVVVNVGDVSVTLSIDELGKPHLDTARNGKRLSSIPPKVKKEAAVAELQARKRDIDKQYSRMRLSLENAMCRGDEFTGKELGDLLAHPVLAPMLEQLLFIGEGVLGYPINEGRALFSHTGKTFKITSDTVLRLAHPHDLFVAGAWHLWQRECFVSERIQPFKQVFRELYVVTQTEATDGATSQRYAGHQVQPKQAMALLGSRGWVTNPEIGVMKTFHYEGYTAWLTFQYGYFSPLEVEGLTVDHVTFTRPGEWKPVPLTEVPPRIFSEIMRDLDLVVSVAHRGGVDPEHSASTVEMRSALVRETMALLKIDNVELKSQHAIIEGKLGSYSVHLGSGVVHRQPGGSLCVVPVHAQHRGRLFLPFADDDPKTAEVLSKVLLFARDSDIKDPTILEQIVARG